jgi:ankyrin repeat protein
MNVTFPPSNSFQISCSQMIDTKEVDIYKSIQANSTIDFDQLKDHLQSKKIGPENISDEIQAEIWKSVPDDQTMELLGHYRFNINAKDAQGQTPLMHWAQDRRNTEHFNLAHTIKALSMQANPLLKNKEGLKASDLAIPNSSLHSLLLAFENAAKQLAVLDFITNPVPSDKSRALISENMDLIHSLIASDPSCLTKKDGDGLTLFADSTMSEEAFKLLVDANPNPIAGGEKGSALFFALRKRAEILEYLLNKKSVNIEKMSPSLQVAAWFSTVGSDAEKKIRLLKNYGFNPNVQNERGNTALMRIVIAYSQDSTIPKHHRLNAIKTLIEIGTDLSLTNQTGKTAKELTSNPDIIQLFNS